MITLPDMNLDFDADTHTYRLRGIRLPSVTQIMRPMTLMTYEGVSAATLDTAADRGSRAHEQISNYVKYGVLESDPDTEPYINAFLKFEGNYEPEWLGSEVRTYHKTFNYAGTVDLIGFVGPSRSEYADVDIIDIKTTAAYHPVLLSTQLSAYDRALYSHGVLVRKRYGLQLLRTGEYRLEKLEDNFSLFLHCMSITNAMGEEIRR